MKITSIATALLLTFATTIASAQILLVVPLSLSSSSAKHTAKDIEAGADADADTGAGAGAGADAGAGDDDDSRYRVSTAFTRCFADSTASALAEVNSSTCFLEYMYDVDDAGYYDCKFVASSSPTAAFPGSYKCDPHSRRDYK